MPGSDARAEDEAEPDDRALLAAHVAGDPDAFGVLFGRHRDRLWAVALRTSGDPEEAADALQDALVSAFRRAESFRGDSAVTTWLHRIVVNACLDRLRRQKVRATSPLPDGDDTDRLPPRAAVAGHLGASHATTDPADVVLDAEQRALVTRALSSLPVEQRSALVLVDMQGFSVHEAAQVLGCAPGTVKSRCSRGRARLAPLLLGLSGRAGAGGPADAGGPTRPSEPSRTVVRPTAGEGGGDTR